MPFAVRAASAANADNAENAANATTAANSLSLGGVAASQYITITNGGSDFIRNSGTTQSNASFNISGSGIINQNFAVAGNIFGAK